MKTCPTNEKVTAYAAYRGHYAAIIAAAKVRNTLDAMISDLRGDRNFSASDQLRILADKLDQSVAYVYPDLSREKYKHR